MPTVTVNVPVNLKVPYTIEVENLEPETIRKALAKKDPSEWDTDPSFYEKLGEHWTFYVAQMTDEKIKEATEVIP